MNKVVGFALQLSIFVVALDGIQTCAGLNIISRRSFPKGFVFGTASSAYQYEGAVQEAGRGQTIWDTFAHTSGKVVDGSNGDVATDQYHLYPEDIQLMKGMGFDAYRFSIAWSRIYPDGAGAINQAGINHYNNLMDTLIANGIQPYVTLFHWDLPQALEDKYTGWLSKRSIQDFAAYAETCFKEFGDRVKHWITINEPQSYAVQGYNYGINAPGRCSDRLICKGGNGATEPYIVGHNMLLAHATVVDVYRKKYKPTQHGSIGISLNTFWYEPEANTTAAIEATQRAIDFNLGWFLEPLITGDYPRTMRIRVGKRLPKFTSDQATLLKGAHDFIGLNHYTTWFANEGIPNALADSGAITLPIAKGKRIPERANSLWLFIVPHGMRNLTNYIKNKYGNPPVIITENGMDDGNPPFQSIKDALKDEKRIRYHDGYLSNLLAAIKEDGCNVGGYFAWSLLDNWEWAFGYTSRFGLFYVDFKDKSRKRYAKDSAKWFKEFLES